MPTPPRPAGVARAAIVATDVVTGVLVIAAAQLGGCPATNLAGAQHLVDPPLLGD